MAGREEVMRSFARILREVGDPPIRLVFEGEWRELAGRGIGSAEGRASRRAMLVTTRYRGRDLASIETTLWHEVAHILFPHRRHWWIECFASRMTGAPVGRYSRRYHHSPDELPSREALITMARRSSARRRRASASSATSQGRPPAPRCPAERDRDRAGASPRVERARLT